MASQRKTWALVVGLLAVLGPGGPALAQTAGMVGFQGLIKDAGGVPVSGPVTLQFRIFDAQTLGSLVDMDGDGAVENIVGQDVTQVVVTATNGVVSTKFGPVSPKAFDGNPRWLEVSIAGSPLSRIEMATAPATSEQINAPASGTPVASADDKGNLGIGTTAPTARLHVKSAAPILATGAIASSPDSTTITGAGTAFTSELNVGDTLVVSSPVLQKRPIIAIASDTVLTVQTPFNPELPAQAFSFQQPIVRHTDDAGNTALIVCAEGSVGIGTANVRAKLDVAGTIKGIGSAPIGSVTMWAGPVANPPTGWKLCDGNALDKNQFPELFEAIGTIHGGDGNPMFNLPNFSNRSPMGASTDDLGIPKTAVSGSLTQSGGAATHTLTMAQMPAHTHTINFLIDAFFATQWNLQLASSGGGFQTPGSLTTTSRGGNQAHNNLHPYFAITYIIYTGVE